MGRGVVAAIGLCLVDRKGEEVVPLRPRYIIKAEDVSLHCTLHLLLPSFSHPVLAETVE